MTMYEYFYFEITMLIYYINETKISLFFEI